MANCVPGTHSGKEAEAQRGRQGYHGVHHRRRAELGGSLSAQGCGSREAWATASCSRVEEGGAGVLR